MKILIYGGNGWIGSQFTNLLNEYQIQYVIGSVRVDNYDSLLTEIEEHWPTHIVSFIGRTHGKIGNTTYPTIDYLEQKGKLLENIRDNLFSPLQLALICNNKNIHFTYLGTGCIFEYDDEHKIDTNTNGFTEESKPNFYGSSYSIVKGFTDTLMHYFDNVLNLRIRMPINEDKNSRNFITKITTYKKICSIPNSMSVLSVLLPYVIDMMRKKIIGTFNLTNPGTITHNQILELYKQIVDPSFVWENFTIDEQTAVLAAGRSNNYLDTTKLQSLYPDIMNIHDAVKDCLYKYPKPNVILVTGGCGFIGSNYVNYMLNKYPNVKIVNIDALYYCASVNNVNENNRNSNKYVFVKGNICDDNLVLETLTKYNCSYCIHFAAQSHVQNSFTDALSYTKDNVYGTHMVLEACRKYGKLKKIIHVSTDEVYGESMMETKEQHKTEQSILCPTNPYAATKAGAELIAQSYTHSFNMPIIITRGNNVYGINQYPEKLIPLFIQLLFENKKVTIQGDGSNLRSFLHVDDTASAFDIILQNGECGNIYNIGCDGMEYSVRQIAELLIRLIKNTTDYNEWIEYIPDRPYNDKRYLISNQKLKDIGWTIEKQDFEYEIQKIIEHTYNKMYRA
jgi:dTDP-glucose 4,6-dehydratase